LLQTFLHTENFSSTINGEGVQLYFLENEFLQLAITNYGATIVALRVKNSSIPNESVIAGFVSLQKYITAVNSYYGCTVGRVANRIANAKFTLNDKEYILQPNNDGNCLHGGVDALHTKVWKVNSVTETSIELNYFSKDGEAGFPANVHFTTTFSLQQQQLQINYTATTDASTPINLTNHSYFNLNGVGNGDILQHQLQIDATAYLPINEKAIPTGVIANVKGTAFDFLQPKVIGKDINREEEQLQIGKGYDHCFVLNTKGNIDEKCAALIGDISGIKMNVYTTKLGMQLYTGNYMQGQHTFFNGAKDEQRTAVCLETQSFPDSVNQPNFPITIITPTIPYSHTTIYEFL
jgi:aldose 1-epimerase